MQIFFEYLPTEIISHILSLLDLNSLKNSFISCKSFYEISNHNSLWKKLCKKICHYTSEKDQIQLKKNLQTKDWKKICKFLIVDRVKMLSNEQQFALHFDQLNFNDYEIPIGESLIEV